jgi:DNA-binding GntR family transcriptional regulator
MTGVYVPKPLLPNERRSTVADQTYELLRTWLVSGDLAPGARVSERELAQMLDVSRTPLRSALARLENDALLRRNRSGTLEVLTLGVQEVDSLYACRAALDVLAARLAAETASAEDVASLQQAVDEAARAYVLGDIERMVVGNGRFHALLYDASHNEWPARILRPQQAHFERIRVGLMRHATRGPAFVAEHQGIVDGIRARDPVQAEIAVQEHMASIASRVFLNREAILGVSR